MKDIKINTQSYSYFQYILTVNDLKWNHKNSATYNSSKKEKKEILRYKSSKTYTVSIYGKTQNADERNQDLINGKAHHVHGLEGNIDKRSVLFSWPVDLI